MIKVLLWDVDGTLLNFLEAEKIGIRNGFARLGLGECTDEMLADYIIQRLLDRKYKRNGEGGLFTVNNGEDLRTVEIWYQLGWFLNSIIF